MTVLNFETLVAGSIWLALGVTTYVLYRRHLGLSLTETHKIVLPKPAVEHEVEYESILVAFEDANYSPEAVATAVRLPLGADAIHVLVTITVPPNVPIDAEMPALESRAATAIDSARVRGGRRVTGHWEKVRPGRRKTTRRRGKGHARPRDSDVVSSAADRRSLFGRTLETVLAERPCRVIIDSSRGLRGAEPGRAPPAATTTA